MHEIKIEAPGKNALSTDLMRSLIAQLKATDGQPVLLTGSGDSFSAGLNLKEVVGLDLAGMQTFLGLLGELTTNLFEHPAPTVAAVNGHAIAGGCVVALCCDYRVGTTNPKTKIGLNEVMLGLRFPPQILRQLAHQIGMGPLQRAVLGARVHPPEAALAAGFLDELADDPVAVGRERLAGLASHPADAYAAAKRTLRSGVAPSSPEEERAFREEVIPTWVAEDLKAKIRAVLGG